MAADLTVTLPPPQMPQTRRHRSCCAVFDPTPGWCDCGSPPKVYDVQELHDYARRAVFADRTTRGVGALPKCKDCPGRASLMCCENKPPSGVTGVPALKTWQHDETGRITEATECPGRRWSEVPAAGVAAVQPPGDVVVTKNPAGQIVAVTRQDAEGRILSVIAESAAGVAGTPAPELTDEEIVALIEHADGSEFSDLEFARAVIAADRAKRAAGVDSPDGAKR